MKVDKETLIKHQFWIGMAVFVPLVVFTLIWLSSSTADATEAKKKELDAHLNELKLRDENRPKRKNDVAQLEALRQQLEKRKEEIWEKAWKMQEDLLSWPTPEIQEKIAPLKFGTDVMVLGEKEASSLRANYARKDVYDPQIEQLANTFRTRVTAGKDEKTFDAVEFKGGWKKVLTYVKDWNVKSKSPSSEEVWLAQEDIWLQRELLRALLEANNTVARFKKIEGPAAGAGELFRQQFRNDEWQLDLIVFQSKDGKYGLRGKIKNVSGKPLPIGQIFFLVQMFPGGGQPVVLPVQGETLPADKEATIADHLLDLNNRPDGLLGVTQLFEGRTGPIRRIDQIVIGGQAHRTYYPKLLMSKFSKEVIKDAAAKAAAAGPLAKGPDLSRTEYGLLRERYAVTTDQVRRIPLAVVVLADQAHAQEILTALTNSKFRFQVTQVGWQHHRGSASAEEEAAPVRPVPGDAKKEPEEMQTNLIELVIYCVASIYEKFEAAPAGRDVTVIRPRPGKTDKDAPMPKE